MKILVCEDNVGLGEPIATFLRAHGHTVLFYDSHQDALQSVDSPDLALVDLSYDLDNSPAGLAVAELMAGRNAYVVLMTGAADEDLQGLAIGRYRILRKPFGLKEIKELMSSLPS